MKIKDAIAGADEVKPTAFTGRVKFEWLNAREGKIAADVFLLAPAEVRTLHYVYPEDLETELLVGAAALGKPLPVPKAGYPPPAPVFCGHGTLPPEITNRIKE